MAIIGFLLGAILGSLAKALADRSLRNKTYLGRSYCPHCKNILRWYDLLPIASYLMLRGKCRYCRYRIGVEYLVMEMVMGFLIGFLFWQHFRNLQSIFNYQFSIFLLDLLFKTFFITVLAILFLTDIKKMFIPDRIIIPAIWVSIIFITVITIIKGRLLTAEPLLSSALMGLLIGSFFLALIVITRGKGMGGGDVKLGAFMGLGLGFPASLVALIVAFLSGAVVSLILVTLGRKHFGQVIPFGPFLVIGSLIALFWGDWLALWYLTINF